MAYPNDSQAPTTPNIIPSTFFFSPNLSKEFWRPEFKNVAPRKYIIIDIVNNLNVFIIDNMVSAIIITIKDINNCFLTPILSLVHPPIGANIPNINKYTEIIIEV